MFGTSRDVRRDMGSLSGLLLVGEVCAEEVSLLRNAMGRRVGIAFSDPFAPTSELLCFSASFLQSFASYCSVAATCWSPSASLVSGMRQT